MKKYTASLVILTYKRKSLLLSLMNSYWALKDSLAEIIIVDNKSEEGLKAAIESEYPTISVIELDENVGTEGRNIGIKAASSDVIILLDDDVFGLSPEEIDNVLFKFEADNNLAALCFKVIHAETNELINWCHHKPKEIFSDSRFETYEITEGAVAVRRDAFLKVGGFPGHFFISHEGPDLALRLIDAGYSIWYDPAIVVKHHQSTLGRASWRRYYYDTRNVIWLSIRNYSFISSLKFLIIQLAAMFVYSLRDGFLRYYFKAIYFALKDMDKIFKERKVISKGAELKIKLLSVDDEGFFTKVKKRIFKSGVGI